jgi:transposase
MTYSLDFRKKVLSIKETENLSFAQTAKRFDIGIASIVRWTKHIEAKTSRNKPATKINMEALRKDIRTYPDAYQRERAERFGISKSGIWHALNRLKITRKKKASSIPRRTKKNALSSARN